jgi:hypothetical protein
VRDGPTDVYETGELLYFELDNETGIEAVGKLLNTMLDGRIEDELLDEATAESLTTALDEEARIDERTFDGSKAELLAGCGADTKDVLLEEATAELLTDEIVEIEKTLLDETAIELLPELLPELLCNRVTELEDILLKDATAELLTDERIELENIMLDEAREVLLIDDEVREVLLIDDEVREVLLIDDEVREVLLIDDEAREVLLINDDSSVEDDMLDETDDDGLVQFVPEGEPAMA